MKKPFDFANDSQIKNIIVVGGGSSGWIAASCLLKGLDFNVNITVIESEKIGRIGVGEATLPSIKNQLFDFLEIKEEEWMPKCNGSFKIAIKFSNWKRPLSQGGDHYYHSFGEMPDVDGIPLSHWWMAMREKNFGEPMDYSCYSSPHICERNKSPKFMDGTPAVHYAYHFDAMLMADFLMKWSIDRGVKHVKDELVTAGLDENGNIAFVKGQSGEKYEADLFIDCSGFDGFLIEKILHEPLISFADSLLTNSAIAINAKDAEGDKTIRPYTSATALDFGWVWEIPLVGRSGNGYVYSDHFTTPEKAEDEFRKFLKKDGRAVHISFKSGRRKRSWVKNCVSIGLSSNFLEPLESTGIYFVYAAIHQLLQYLPDKNMDPILRQTYNDRVAYMVEDVKDFIVLHFCTSPREDTSFWKANKYELKKSPLLETILEQQKAGIVIKKSYRDNMGLYSNFEAAFDRFWTNSNYQSIFCGVGYLPQNLLPILKQKPTVMEKAQQTFSAIQRRTENLLQELPSNYDFLHGLRAREKEEAMM